MNLYAKIAIAVYVICWIPYLVIVAHDAYIFVVGFIWDEEIGEFEEKTYGYKVTGGGWQWIPIAYGGYLALTIIGGMGVAMFWPLSLIVSFIAGIMLILSANTRRLTAKIESRVLDHEAEKHV